jgi:cation transport regulator ChaC
MFGYGRLIYSPIIDQSQRTIASIYDYHQRFSLETKIDRGSLGCPGLLLSLDRGNFAKVLLFDWTRKIPLLGWIYRGAER